ncbi:hypothetical protein PCASD_26557 [Puccinia coronata f. sp. avenae]|uniref:Uncharacterized protein n=1 Tax=Puccinia coronata f. sp. avenae TaxID=200324 RepID=A0A2N5THR2_9BASI|nr:hypothetical protein PCASD_26711 [Puccinia coronata f. sp. avenae]PLW25092.1 hypothetical protein PCASD_26557 [Puccinia coronata f. sp. avenae]
MHKFQKGQLFYMHVMYPLRSRTTYITKTEMSNFSATTSNTCVSLGLMFRNKYGFSLRDRSCTLIPLAASFNLPCLVDTIPCCRQESQSTASARILGDPF